MQVAFILAAEWGRHLQRRGEAAYNTHQVAAKKTRAKKKRNKNKRKRKKKRKLPKE
jgi:hypothetical protein